MNASTTVSRKNVLCLYTCRMYDNVVQFSLPHLSELDHVVSLRRELEDFKVEGGFDFLKAAQVCVTFIETNNIDSVIALNDDTAPILSLLVEKYGKSKRAFRGPSFEALYLTINKFYTRELLDPDPLPYCHIDLNNIPTALQLESTINEIGLPAILKPTCGSGSLLIQKVNSLQDLIEALRHAEKHYSSLIGKFTSSISKNLDAKKFPVSLTDGMILEKYVDGDILDLDGYIFDGKVCHWALCDLSTWQCNPSVIQMLMLPCTQPAEVQARAWAMFDTIANRLAQYGFDYQFVNIQLFLCKNGDLKLLEINGRMTAVCSPICQRSLFPGDTIEAQLRLARGEEPRTPHPTGVHSAYVSIRSTISGKASDIIDFKVAETMENINMHVDPDFYIQPVGDGGKGFGSAYLFANSRKELLQKHCELYESKLFKKHPLGCKCDSRIHSVWTQHAG